MVEIINGFAAAYNGLPPWLQTAIEIYVLPAVIVWALVEGAKTLYKKATKKSLHGILVFFIPWIMAEGWVVFNAAKQSLKTGDKITALAWLVIFGSGIGLGLASNVVSIVFEFFFNRFKKEEKAKAKAPQP